MAQRKLTKEEIEKTWRSYLMTGEVPDERLNFFESIFLKYRLAQRMPSEPRCRTCHIPFHGAGGALIRATLGRKPSKLNPQLCNECEQFADKYNGGAEVEMTILFTDLRGSTPKAEELGTIEFSRWIDRFYKAVTRVLVESDALIEKLVGDQVTGIFVPGFAGKAHAARAINAARKILLATGHGESTGPWAPVGIGIHTGSAFMGSVGLAEGVNDIVTLGEAVNTTARITAAAASGEILVTQSALANAKLENSGLEKRTLSLKGVSQPVEVWRIP